MPTITLTGCEKAPSWTTVEKMLQEMFSSPKGRLVRVRNSLGNSQGHENFGEFTANFEKKPGACSFPVKVSITQ